MIRVADVLGWLVIDQRTGIDGCRIPNLGRIRFRPPPPPPPDPEFIRIHAAVAKVLNLSGAVEYAERLEWGWDNHDGTVWSTMRSSQLSLFLTRRRLNLNIGHMLHCYQGPSEVLTVIGNPTTILAPFWPICDPAMPLFEPGFFI
jgi:hypothetical protein